ncbi:MAG TPA: radical SAM protein [Candidatus Bathyarchaeia archaeon]|nr:radical SAM protein [Candidatus Bathyarchaeia archaeon]
MAQKYVFGPALSRRLGRSLGIDVVPFKTCTYDCVYCQLGPTTVHTLERKPYVPLDEVLDELRSKLETGVLPDYVTIGGSGEPTLYSEIGPLITGIKSLTPTPVAVLTNGSLLWDPEVRDALNLANVVLPSLDASDAQTFLAVNQPIAAITYERMIAGLESFRETYSGQIWLEIFLTAPIEPQSPAIDRFIDCIGRIRPDKIHLNTLARPAPGSTAVPVAPNIMQKIARRIGPNAEVIANFPNIVAQASRLHVSEDEILALVRRHPCSLQDIAAGLSIPVLEAMKHVEHLLQQGKLTAEYRNNVAFYLAANRN